MWHDPPDSFKGDSCAGTTPCCEGTSRCLSAAAPLAGSQAAALLRTSCTQARSG
jgi:hypothetical protein